MASSPERETFVIITEERFEEEKEEEDSTVGRIVYLLTCCLRSKCYRVEDWFDLLSVPHWVQEEAVYDSCLPNDGASPRQPEAECA